MMEKVLLVAVALLAPILPMIAEEASARGNLASTAVGAPAPPAPAAVAESPLAKSTEKGERILCSSARTDANSLAYPLVGLFGDTLGGPGGANHSRCGIDYIPAPYTSIEMWVWWLADPQWGLKSGEFKINYPTSTYMIQGAVTSNEKNCVEIGILASGVSFSVFCTQGTCAYGWYWSHWQQLYVKRLTPMEVQIVGNPPDGGHIYATTCIPAYCLYEGTVLNNLYINEECMPGVATKSVSWGTIKSLYRE